MEFPTYEQFTAWLESKKPFEIIGVAHSTCDCPAANCARHYGASNPYVTPRRWIDSGTTADTPGYVQRFVALIDASHAYFAEVSAGAAAAALILAGV